MDNVIYNKCHTVIGTMSMLTLLGIVRKVKLSYLVVGHTHEDVDATIGNVVTHLRAQDLPTYSEFREQCLVAIRKDGGAVLDVHQIIGCTDFDEVFQKINKFNVDGISAAHTIRITAAPDGSGPVIFYKEDNSKPG